MYIYIYIYTHIHISVDPAVLEDGQGEERRCAASFLNRRRENMVGANIVLAEYHQNTLK